MISKVVAGVAPRPPRRDNGSALKCLVTSLGEPVTSILTTISLICKCLVLSQACLVMVCTTEDITFRRPVS